MTWFIWQTLMLMLLAFFLGAALACLLRRLVAPQARVGVHSDAGRSNAGLRVPSSMPLPSSAAPGVARSVEPLPNLPPRPVPPAPPPSMSNVNKLERALGGVQQEMPRPAPHAASPPVVRPPAAAAPIHASGAIASAVAAPPGCAATGAAQRTAAAHAPTGIGGDCSTARTAASSSGGCDHRCRSDEYCRDDSRPDQACGSSRQGRCGRKSFPRRQRLCFRLDRPTICCASAGSMGRSPLL